MLAFSRKSGQTIHIGQEIELEVVEIDQQRVRLRVSTPENVNVTVRRAECAPGDGDESPSVAPASHCAPSPADGARASNAG